MTVLIDLDGVICTEEKTFERALAKPLPGAQDALKALADDGHTIVIYTSRSWSELKMTTAWLEEHKIPYHGIHMGKPVAERIIDDRAVAFNDWGQALQDLGSFSIAPKYGPTDEYLLRRLREETKLFLEAISRRNDLVEPIVEVGPMTASGMNSPVFARMPETFIDSRTLFSLADKQYFGLDIDVSSTPDLVADVSSGIFGPSTVGTIVMMSCLEHLPEIWKMPQTLFDMLKPGGRAFILTPWNLRFHGPRPDCWRISDDGYRSLFGKTFEIESLEQIPCPGRPLSPIGMKCTLRKPSR